MSRIWVEMPSIRLPTFRDFPGFGSEIPGFSGIRAQRKRDSLRDPGYTCQEGGYNSGVWAKKGAGIPGNPISIKPDVLKCPQKPSDLPDTIHYVK
jgi:hypothetical protein